MISPEYGATSILNVCLYACVLVSISMHLYNIPSDADEIPPKEGVMVFPPFVLEEGKTLFFLRTNALLFLMQSLSKRPTQMRIASYFCPLGTASFNF